MNKAELISAIATDAGVSKSVASKVLDSVINNVTESLKIRAGAKLAKAVK